MPRAEVADPTESDGPPLPYPRPDDREALGEAEDESPSAPATAAPAADDADAVEAEATTLEGIVPLPRSRPDAAADDGEDGTIPANAVEQEYREVEPAPPRIYQTACPAVLLGRVEATMLEPIADEACGTQSPLSVTAVLANGRMVPFSGAAITDCGMASALPAWIEAIDSWLFARENTRLAEIIVGTSYMCRRVNNASSGNLSFHAFADALDIVGFRLEDGRSVTVEGDWADPDAFEGRFLRYAHGAACSNFTTVLGPEANALHHDHFHLDLGCHGKTCTARICE